MTRRRGRCRCRRWCHRRTWSGARRGRVGHEWMRIDIFRVSRQRSVVEVMHALPDVGFLGIEIIERQAVARRRALSDAYVIICR